MKHFFIQQILIIPLFLLLGCHDCGTFKEQSKYFYEDYEKVYKNNILLFEQLRIKIDSLQLSIHKDSLKNDISRIYHADSIDYVDNHRNKYSGAFISAILKKINCEDIIISFTYYPSTDESISTVIIDPIDMKKYNYHSSCPSFFGRFVYSAKKLDLPKESPNSIFYKLSDYWSLQTMINSL